MRQNVEIIENMVTIVNRYNCRLATRFLSKFKRQVNIHSSRVSKLYHVLHRIEANRNAASYSTFISSLKQISDRTYRISRIIERRLRLKYGQILKGRLGIRDTAQGEDLDVDQSENHKTSKSLIRSNGYNYLSIVLRKHLHSRLQTIFDVYSHHTSLMQKAHLMNTVLTRRSILTA